MVLLHFGHVHNLKQLESKITAEFLFFGDEVQPFLKMLCNASARLTNMPSFFGEITVIVWDYDEDKCSSDLLHNTASVFPCTEHNYVKTPSRLGYLCARKHNQYDTNCRPAKQ